MRSFDFDGREAQQWTTLNTVRTSDANCFTAYFQKKYYP